MSTKKMLSVQILIPMDEIEDDIQGTVQSIEDHLNCCYGRNDFSFVSSRNEQDSDDTTEWYDVQHTYDKPTDWDIDKDNS